MKEKFLVSIVVIIHNNLQGLFKTVESCLCQTHRNIEIIIIDRSCAAQIEAAVAELLKHDKRISYYKTRGSSLGKALNYGFSLAKGDYFSWLKAGSKYLPQAITVMIAQFAACDGIGMVYANVEGNTIRDGIDTNASVIKLYENNCIGPCFLYNRKVYEEIGNYNEDMEFSVEYEYWFRVWKKFIIQKIDDTLLITHLNELDDNNTWVTDLIVRYNNNSINDLDIIKIATDLIKRAQFTKLGLLIRHYRNNKAEVSYIKQMLLLPVPAFGLLYSIARKVKNIIKVIKIRSKFSQLQKMPTVELQRKIANSKIKIGLAVLAHERPEYLKICLDSLFQTDLHNYEVTFLIQDDGSIDPRVRELIEQPRDPKYNIIRYFTPKGHNSWGAAFNKAIKKLLEIDDFDIVGTCDSDALFHPDWLDQTLKVCLWAKEHHLDHNLGPFSSFNSSDVEFHGILGTYQTPYGNYTVKRRMGAVNYFYFKDDLLKLGLFEESKDDETLMTEKFESFKIRNFCTEISYVEHIGKNSILDQWRPTPVGENAVYALNSAKFGWTYDMEKINPITYYKSIKDNQFNQPNLRSELPIDVVIPVTEKDMDMLPFTIAGLRENIRHPINSIRLVAPKSKMIIDFCASQQCKFINEDDCLPIRKRDISYKVKDVDRSGWLFQQFLKWSDYCAESENYLVLDSDTVLIRPHVFEINGKTVFFHSDERHQPYYDFYYKIMGQRIVSPLSFVAHYMLINKQKLTELKTIIEKRHNDRWYNVIVNNVICCEPSCFSEYETYGNWMLTNYREKMDRYYWSNLACSRKCEIMNYDILKKKYSSSYRVLSFHSYI